MNKEDYLTGRIFELSSERKITGRREIKVVLHEIFPDSTQYQSNGISWNEEYTRNALDSVTNMSLCVEFIDADRSLPYGHGLTSQRDNMPLLENATVVGHFCRGYVTDVELNGVKKRVLAADGYVDEMRYPAFVAWLEDHLKNNGAVGSVEIVGRAEHGNHIVYDGGWKEKGRVPMVYDYSGYAIVSLTPADSSAVVMELNTKGENKEDLIMDEKTKQELVTAVAAAVSEQTNATITELNTKISDYEEKITGYEQKISELQAANETQAGQIAELNTQLEAEKSTSVAKDATIEEQTAELNTLRADKAEAEKNAKINELNTQLAEFSDAEKECVKEDIEKFNADPTTIEINTITGKICAEIVRKAKEHQSDNLDIFGGARQNSNGSVPNIFG